MFLDAKCVASMMQARKTFEERLCPSTSSSFFSTIKYGRFPEWPKGTDCKSAGFAFGGSNPPSPTKTDTAYGGVFVLMGEAWGFERSRLLSAVVRRSNPKHLIVFWDCEVGSTNKMSGTAEAVDRLEGAPYPPVHSQEQNRNHPRGWLFIFSLPNFEVIGNR